MTPAAEVRILTILAFLVTVIVAIWIGGSVTVDALVVPSLFDLLSREQAGDVGGAFFQRWNFAECLLGAAAVLLAFAMGMAGWRTRRRHLTGTGLLLVMTLIALVFLLVLTPAMDKKWESLKELGVNVNDPEDTGQEREAFRSLHRLYAMLDVLKILGGFAVFWLLAGRKPQ
ncbi:MAG: DUF4149 domain-containing protein [Planctomycetota bacterium]|jgi:uncharacterized membrane protein